jgi:hypothetical protein
MLVRHFISNLRQRLVIFLFLSFAIAVAMSS